MAAAAQLQVFRPRKLAILWLVPIQAASIFTVWAISNGGQTLRAWILSALTWLMTLPLLVSLEGTLVAMMLFEPVRGLIRRAQYLIVDYASEDPIHLVTPVVTFVALLALLRIRRLEIFRATTLAPSVSLLALWFLIEMFNPLQGGLFVGISGALFTLVPLVWFYFGQSVNERFMYAVMRLIVFAGILASCYGVYQMLAGYPKFEQYWIDNTEFYKSITVGHVTRALATFTSAEEWARYTEIGAIIAFGFAAGAKRLARVGWLLCGVALLGAVSLSGQRTAVFGTMLGIALLVLLGAGSFPRAVARLAMVLLPVVLVLVFVQPPADDELWTKDENQTVSAVLTHTQRGTLKPAEEGSLQERLQNWTYLVTQVIPYRPLGAGLGAGMLSETRFSRDNDDLPPIDNYILELAIGCGIPGALLFTWILLRASWLSLRTARQAQSVMASACINRIVASVMAALVLNNVFGVTFTIYSVAPIGWLFIGWISAERLRARTEPEREVLTI